MRIRYRGFGIRPFIRWKPLQLGRTRVYCIGPIAIFLEPPDQDQPDRNES